MSVQRVRDEQIKITNLPEGRLTNVSGSVSAIKENLAAIAAPTGSDNFAAGYSVGSRWIYSGIIYDCTGDGTWQQIYPAIVDGTTVESIHSYPTGTKNGVNDTFTLAAAITDGDLITHNGQVLEPGVDYTAVGTTLTFLTFAPESTDKIEVRHLNGNAFGEAGEPPIWGTIGGDIADQTDLAAVLGGKQAADANLTALAGITVARGTIPVGNSTPAWSGLAKGSAYLPLRMDSSGNDPGYGTLQPQGGGTGLTSYTAGDILYCSATNVLSKLAKGTDGQFLSLASGVPVWVNGGGLKYVDTLYGTSAATSDTSIATSAALAAGTYLCKFYESHNSLGGQCGYKINSGSTIWVLGPGGNSSPSATMALEITVTAGQTLDLRGANGSATTSSYALEIWGPV